MSSSAKPRQPRLRASCDGCFIAKVKCSKARPICSRCLACGLECRYSPSSRAGKPKSDAYNATQQQTGPSHQGMTAALDDNSLMYHAYASPMGLYRTETGWNTPPSLDGSMSRNPNLAPGAATRGMDDQTRDDQREGMDMYGVGMTPWISATEMSSSHFTEMPMGQSSLSPNDGRSPFSDTGMPMPLVSPWVAVGDGLPQDAQLYETSNALPTSANMGSNYFPSPSTTPNIPHRHHPTPVAGGAGICACFTFCLQSLQGLHNASALSVPSLDAIVSLNRKAVESCAALLTCPRCTERSGCPTSSMLLATILGKAAGFYRVAAQVHLAEPSTTARDAPSPSSIHQGNSASGGHEVRWMELEILVREIGRLEEVCSQYRDACSNLSEEAEVNRAMVGYLIRSLGATMEAVKRKQGARYV
ncbi:uncharacterized protein DNG_01261 [Cephalotrichum gorgonifer]|uniref:Zn(2)-C6 fungal-type domain-containing protein n=1 Tax=Cephalotrichum gorgonifer TaxID=2041049 RepID=A0AAE8MSR6_9PEZI|nr:uncharacterized protein DNG_01261 [Cephalotrichum gorgonifer]